MTRGDHSTYWHPPRVIEAVIGIDPGKSGGICLKLLYPTQVKEIQRYCDTAFPMPVMSDNEVDYDRVLWFLRQCKEQLEGGVAAVLEQQWARQNDHKGKAFHYGDHYGQLQMALRAADIFTTIVSPMKWMATVGVGKKSDHASPDMSDAQIHAAWKRHLRDKAAMWYPDLKPTLKTGDAILIAEYGHLLHTKGELLVCRDEPKTKAKGKRRSAKRSKSTTATKRQRPKS